jgi:uncharacterized protein YcfJ
VKFWRLRSLSEKIGKGINEVFESLRARRIDDKVAGLAYGEKEFELMFYGQAVQECIDISRRMIKAPIKIVERVKVELQTCTRERPVIGGTCMGSQRRGSICATIGWVANKLLVSRGIITVAHAVNQNDFINNNLYIESDKIARANTIIDDSYVDTAYCLFLQNIYAAPAIKNLGFVVAWMGYYSVPIVLSISFISGYGLCRRKDTRVIAKGYLAGKYNQVAVEPITVGGDSGAAYANYNPDTGK